MNLYFVFAYGPRGNFIPMRLVSELSWARLSEQYLSNHLKLQLKTVATWTLVDTRCVDSIKYSELSLLDEATLIDKTGRVGDSSDFRRNFIIRRLAGF